MAALAGIAACQTGSGNWTGLATLQRQLMRQER
jgi:hypothetical protein